MPDLIHSLQSSDLGQLRIIASFWGLELASPDPRQAVQELSAAMLDSQLVLEIIESLPDDAKESLEALLQEKVALLEKFSSVASFSALSRVDICFPAR